MLTKWGKALDATNILPEYPRPQFQRQNCQILNGAWEYAFTALGAQTPPPRFEGTILVPFSPESELSGVKRTLKPNECLWYRRYVETPAGFDPNQEDLILHFGAVDQFAELRVNGMSVLNHAGGYLPFSAVVSEFFAQGGVAEVVVRVRDETDTSCWSRGKQSSAPGGIWYTPQSGIWQTVWMERVPKRRVDSLAITPLFDESAVEFLILTNCGGAGSIRIGMSETPFTDGIPVKIPMPEFAPWSPEHPMLYDCSITMERDRVESYFGMRKFAVEKDADGKPRLFLNNKPYFHNGVLDQGYWPDGLYTAPSDEAMVYDISLMKSMGFNMLRKHIKIEPLRWYYHCDRLGMLVWQDMVNGGGKYGTFAIASPLVLGNSHPDSDYAFFAREEVRGREAYARELRETVRHLYNVPSLAMWVPFNEGWGQFDANRAVDEIRALDKTRTVDHASGWHDQKGGDVKSLHVYYKPYRFAPDPVGRAVVLSEFGGYSHHIPEHSFCKKEFGYKRCKTPEALMKDYERLYEREVISAKVKGLSAAVYTQLSDVEQETNGFVTYDREVVKFDITRVRALNEKLAGLAPEPAKTPEPAKE
ncbi:MAG: glycoside hydrolase family 2 TIM barrel-domain containing protein [Clostridiaceae bacterium]